MTQNDRSLDKREDTQKLMIEMILPFLWKEKYPPVLTWRSAKVTHAPMYTGWQRSSRSSAAKIGNY